MELIKFINEELIFNKRDCKTKEEFFKMVHDKAFAKGFVKEEFYEKVLNRENTFPTGINLGEYGVAIPHTDAEYIEKEFIAICNFEDHIVLNSMEDENEKVNVKLAFVLGFNQPHNQLSALQELMGVIQNAEMVEKLINAKEKDEVVKLIESL